MTPDNNQSRPSGAGSSRPRVERGQSTMEIVVRFFERVFFGGRYIVVAAVIGLTAWLGYQASMLPVGSSFDKHLPSNHPYVQTYKHFTKQFAGEAELSVALARTDGGSIYDPAFLERLRAISHAMADLPGVNPTSVTSLFTDNARLITRRDGMIVSQRLVDYGVSENADQPITAALAAQLEADVADAGLQGLLVSEDGSAALVVAALSREKGKLLDLDLPPNIIAEKIIEPFSDAQFTVHVTGYPKLQDEIRSYIDDTLEFFGIAIALTTLTVFGFILSMRLTLLAVGCSVLSMIWHLGLMQLLGLSLDPLAILVPFLVFAIGVSHGVQQINLLSRQVQHGYDAMTAARASYRRLMVPGFMALLTDIIGFGSLALVPIPIVQEIALIAGLGIALKLISNLLVLPVLASFFRFDDRFRKRAQQTRHRRERMVKRVGRIAEPRNAFGAVLFTGVFLGLAMWQSADRHIGDTGTGSPTLYEDATYNKDAALIDGWFTRATDQLIVYAEMPTGSCTSVSYLNEVDQFAQTMKKVPGVVGVTALSERIRAVNGGVLPKDPDTMRDVVQEIGSDSGLYNSDCSVVPVKLSLADHKDTTLSNLTDQIGRYAYHIDIDAKRKHSLLKTTALFCGSHVGTETISLGGKQLETFCNSEPVVNYTNNYSSGTLRGIDALPPISEINQLCRTTEDFTRSAPLIRNAQDYCNSLDIMRLRLAGGNAGLIAATNQEIEHQEYRMFLIIYALIIALVMMTYRDARAAIACTLPLTVSTFLGYWFMNVMGIGLKASTLPVMVLAVGVGVDYAFYIYNRLQHHLVAGDDIVDSFHQSVAETGSAIVVTAFTLAIGVVTWAFSPLKFQADMGMLLAFMLMANMIGTLTSLPALAVVIDKLWPRKGPVPPPLIRS